MYSNCNRRMQKVTSLAFQFNNKLKMKTDYLVTGSTGSIGYAFTKALLENKISTTVLVRDKQKTIKLFDNTDLLEIIEGDVMDVELLKEISNNKKYIFHGINYPYDQWAGNMTAATENIIEAASQNKATIIFPGNIYEFGNVKEITEDMVPNPTTKKGKIRLELFEMLKSAAHEGKCKVIFMRLPDFYGPNVVNGLITRLFGHAVKNKTMNWLIRSDIPHQFVYTPDAARLMLKLCIKTDMPDFALFNYGGMIVPSLNDFANEIAKQSGSPSKLQNLPKFMMNIMALFMPVMKELKENYYLFEYPVILNDDKIRKVFPDFKFTSQEKSIAETLKWFKENY